MVYNREFDRNFAEVMISGNKKKWYMFWTPNTSLLLQDMIYNRITHDTKYEFVTINENASYPPTESTVSTLSTEF